MLKEVLLQRIEAKRTGVVWVSIKRGDVIDVEVGDLAPDPVQSHGVAGKAGGGETGG